jgi:spore photoproduct lyase
MCSIPRNTDNTGASAAASAKGNLHGPRQGGPLMTKIDYEEKFQAFAGRTLYERLHDEDRDAVRRAAFRYRLTFQEFRELAEAVRDLRLWGEPGVALGDARDRRVFLASLRERMSRLRSSPRSYGTTAAPKLRRRAMPVVAERTEKSIWGMCPVASEKTVCCNLRTIDAVENCVFGCSYCSVQTFYSDRVVFDDRLAEKLRAVPVEPDRFYHFGTGQSSDSLAWGNKHGILDALCDFAASHPNVLLELKTKSDNVRELLVREVPENIVCSWSLNPPAVVENEEHFTATTARRLDAARAVADRGIAVAFHFHPMVYYDAWRCDYPASARTLMERFETREVAFVSFGSVTLIKPVIRALRERGAPTRIHQLDLTPDPHGKLTCSDDIKVEMFSCMWEVFQPWRSEVFFYLCMEKASIWERALGFVHDSNEIFEAEFGRAVMPKLRRLRSFHRPASG